MSDSKIKINFKDYEYLVVNGSRVMVKAIPIDYSRTKGGISLGNNVKTTFLQGVVVAVGTGSPVVLHDKLDKVIPPFKVGDVVYYSDMAGAEFKVRRGEYEYEDVRVLDTDSIYFVDGAGSVMYDVV